ncbi:MAG TPA: OmpH family outer membrane protein [Candidatus Acidoferrales bacterium]
MKMRVVIPALMALLLVPAAWGQTGSAAPAAGVTGKVAVINIQTAITGTSEGKQAAAELQSKYNPRQTELDNMRKQIEDIQTRLRNGATTLSDEEKQRLAQEGDRLTRSFQRKQQELQDDGNEDQREIVDRIGRKMLDVIDKYSKENGYAVVFDISAQNTPVVYAANHIDITQDIVKLFDQAYPVKTGTTTPRPAAPRPAATTPPKQPQQ